VFAGAAGSGLAGLRIAEAGLVLPTNRAQLVGDQLVIKSVGWQHPGCPTFNAPGVCKNAAHQPDHRKIFGMASAKMSIGHRVHCRSLGT
jgi:hypothetical protein